MKKSKRAKKIRFEEEEEKTQIRSSRITQELHVILPVVLIVLVIGLIAFSQPGYTGFVIQGAPMEDENMMLLRIVDLSGNPVPGARISAFKPWDGNAQLSFTYNYNEERGLYMLNMDPNVFSFTMEICAPGFEKKQVEFLSRPSMTEISLTPGSSSC